MNQKNRTLRRLGIAGVATAMATVGIPGLASAATLQGAHPGGARVSDLSAPGAPSGLKATDAGAGKIMLSWTAPSGTVSGYNVYVGTAPGNESTTPNNGDVLVRGTTYTVTMNAGAALTNGGTYYFEVAAVNAAGQGALSGEASATASAVAPSAPGGVTATPSAGAVTVNWTAPTTGDTPTSYTVNYGTSSSSLTSSVTVPNSASAPMTMQYINGLNDGTTYYFDVTATNTAGTSTASSTVSATPNTGLVPPPPISVSATGNDGSITVTWSEQDAGANGVTGYNVYEGTSSGGESSTPVNGSVPITGTTTTVSATNGTTEYFTVKAVNSVGMSAASAEASATAGVTVSAAPSAPQFASATALNDAVKLSWKAPASSGDSNVVNYEVLQATSTSGTLSAFSPSDLSGSTTAHSTSGTSTTVTGLTGTNTYVFEVKAINAAGHSSVNSSPTSGVRPAVNSAPESPSGLTVSTSPATTGTANKLSWTAPVYTGGTGVAYGYHVFRNGTEIATITGSTPAVNYTDKAGSTGNSPNYTAPVSGTKYSYKVTAFDNYGASSADGPVSITTGNVTPGAPTSLSATVTGNSAVSLKWVAPADQGAGSLEYNVIERDNTTGTTSSHTATAASYSATTVSGDNYTFTVEAESRASGAATAVLGTSGQSGPVTVTSTATPAVPTGLSAAAVGSSAVKLTWNQPGGAAAPTKYEIFDGTTSTAVTNPVGTIGTSKSFTVTGLTAGTKYYFDVEAANGSAGTSGPSNVASATPTKSSTTAAPGAPTGLQATAEGGLVNLSWTKPSSSGGSPITNYEVFKSGTSFGATTTEIGSTSSTNTSAVLDGLGTGTIDLYVKAVNSSGASSLSAPVEVTPSASNARPSTPGTPVARNEGGGRALVVWTSPSNVGGSAIHGYFVTAHLVGGIGKTVFVKGTNTSAMVAGLKGGGTYYFTVVAVNAVGGGTPSAPSSFVKISGTTTGVKVYVTPPKMIPRAGVTTIRVTTNKPGVQVHLFDEAFGTSHYFQKKIMTTTAQANGTGVAIFKIGIARANHFFVIADGVKSNTVIARVK